MKYNRSALGKLAAAAVVLAAAGTATVAQARSDVFWSVGVQAAPGLSVGFGNVPVYVQEPVLISVFEA